MKLSRKAPSDIRFDGQVAFVTLANSEREFVIDAEDSHLVSGLRWSMTGAGYAQTNFGGKSHFLHRMVCKGLVEGFQVDHINHDRLDNRKCNLRPVTQKGNNNNLSPRTGTKSGYPNVYWVKKRSVWKVQTAEIVDGHVFKNHHHGFFESLEDACRKSRLVLVSLGRFAPPLPTVCL